MAEKLENRIENIENKYEEFLELLKTNPEAIESQVMREQYKELLEHAIEEAKEGKFWAIQSVANLLNINMLDIKDKERCNMIATQVIKWSKYNINWAEYILPELLKLNMVDKNKLKDEFTETIKERIRNCKSGTPSRPILLGLLKLNVVDNSDIKTELTELLKQLLLQFKHKTDYVGRRIPELLKLNIVDKSDIKDEWKDLLISAIEDAKMAKHWAKNVVPKLLEINILDKEDKVRYMNLLEQTIDEAKTNSDIAEHVVPKLLEINILDKEDKVRYMNLLEQTIDEAKTNSDIAKNVVPKLLEINIFEKEDKEWYKNKLTKSVQEDKLHWFWVEHVIWNLLNENIFKIFEIDEKDKERYKTLTTQVMGKAKENQFFAEDVMPKLLWMNILHEDEINYIKNWYKKLLKQYIEESYQYVGNCYHIIPNLLETKILNKIFNKNEINEIKKQYKWLLMYMIKRAKSDGWEFIGIVSKLLKLNILETNELNEVKDWYKWLLREVINTSIEKDGDKDMDHVLMLLEVNIPLNKEERKEILIKSIDKAKRNEYWTKNVVPKLLEINMFSKEDKERYKEILTQSIDKSKLSENWAQYILPKLLEIWMLDKKDKERYKKILAQVIIDSKEYAYLYTYAVPALLKFGIIEKSEINVCLPANITLNWTSFLEKNKEQITAQDIEFIEKSWEFFTDKEIDYLYSLSYKDFLQAKSVIEIWNYQAIWEIKRNCYSDDEKRNTRLLENYIGEWIWTYFVDKVPWNNKTIKDRFRDPHNALLHTTTIIWLSDDLSEKWFSKEEYIKNYLWVAWDRNNWYQQFNNFLEKYKTNWQELIELEMEDEWWLKNNSEFMQYANSILKKAKSLELYKNLDELESILTVLNMINKKNALIKLQKLERSKDSKDKKLYEYYKSAIFHPRTKPIIMDMYEKPLKFLGLDDTTFSELEQIHQAKKPSNMVENFEYLDFDAKDLVNCLPLWVYDKLSYFKQKEMKFYMTWDEVYVQDEIEEEIRKFLKSVGESDIPRIMRRLRKDYDNIAWYQIWKDDNENKDIFINKLTEKYNLIDLINLFKGLWFSKFNKYKDLRLMTAKISPKSDPNNWFNWFNCDSLAEWHGKKVVAMFNPYCTDFCIYEWELDSNKDNLKVTSWVTLNRAIPGNFETLLEKAKSETTHDIANLLWDKFEDYKDPNEYVITMDNIEANPNFGNKYAAAVRKMYEKFFSEYVRENPISPNWIPINTHKFYSWVIYNKIDILNKQVANESLPVFVNAYSDNSKSYSLQWKLDAWEQKEKKKKVWIYPLSIEDVVQISYMEWRIYPESMKDHLWNLQHEITASILNNTLKKRKNLSFAWYNKEWKIWWYILAYQWKMEDWTPWIYISDFAMEKKYRWPAWIEIIHYWMKIVKEKYPDMPVFTRAREGTSYRMIKVYAEKKWYEITNDEIKEDCWENFHWVVMKPIQQNHNDR